MVMNGQDRTVLRYLDDHSDRADLLVKEGYPPPLHGINSLFSVDNASLSVLGVVVDLSSESANHDVKCAVLASSTILVSFCEFLWTDLKSIFVLRSSTGSEHGSSSLTLAWCSLTNGGDHLTGIVEDMRKPRTGETLDMNMVGTRIANMKVAGSDGVCMSQTHRRNDLSSFEGISMTVSELLIANVSSQPGEVLEASSLFSQKMVGCGIWGSNNHLSGSVLRDLNGGGSFLCSNSTFDWCHTTSSDRPSIVRRTSPTVDRPSSNLVGPSDQAEPGDDPADPYTGKLYDDEERFSFWEKAVTFTRCQFKNMKYSYTYTKYDSAGGSAIYLNSSGSSLTLISCSFSKCSVACTSTVYGGCIFMCGLRHLTNTFDSCSFDDWYPSNDAKYGQSGGAIGAYLQSCPLVLTNSNFTLSGDTANENHGGFLSSATLSSNAAFNITNCRFIGDGTTTGSVMSLSMNSLIAGLVYVTDSLILDTNSQISIYRIQLSSSSGFTRTEITNTSIVYTYASSKAQPYLFLDSKIDQCSIETSSSDVMLLFSGTSFTGTPTNTSRPTIYLFSSGHTVFHKCDFTDCSPGTSQSLIYSYGLPSLVVDTCSFTRCSGGKSLLDVSSTYSFFYFCSFTNVTGTSANVLTSQSTLANFFEACRFDLETTNLLDFYVSSAIINCLNETAVIGCTSNRKMYFGTSWANRTEMTFVEVVPVEANKNKLRVGTWPPEEGTAVSSLSEALNSLQPSPMTNVITFSDGPFAETGLLSVSHLVEIVGAGSNLTDSHSTLLSTDGIVSKSTGKLTLQSLRLVPLSSSSFLASTADSGSVCVLNVIVEEVSGITSSLFQLAAGACEIRHSFFKNISCEKSLICLSGTSSLAISNTLFLSIARTDIVITEVESTQCASCIEGKTSGTVKLLYCRFGACTTKGRAGAIDLERSDANSAVEMGSCYFDQNSAGTQVASSVKGDDVVLKSFDESKISLDLSTIQSFPSLSSFLINSEHPIIPPPALLHITSTGIDDPLTWSYTYKRISDSLLKTFTLQYLLEHRLRNNSKTEIKTYFGHNETMTPFIFQNSTVSVSLHAYSFSHLTVNQQNQVFITLEKASLSINGVQFAFEKLTTPAFYCNSDSSITLTNTAFKLTNPTLTHPFIDSVGPYVFVENCVFLQNITLDNTPFVRLIRDEKDAYFNILTMTPLLTSPLTVPFIVCEGAEKAYMQQLKLNFSFVNSASFISAKESALTLYSNQIHLLKSPSEGTFLHLVNGSVSCNQDYCSSSSGTKGGLYYYQNATVAANGLTLSSCSATQGGVLFSGGGSVSISRGSYTNCQADEGGVAYLITSSLSISDTSFISNSAKCGGVFWIDFGNAFASISSQHSITFTSNSAVDVGEDGVDCGKGGAIFVKGKTNSENPIFLNVSRFDENTAAFGNDVFVEETVLGETGPDLLSNCGGFSISRFPHLEIENHNLDDDEILSISNFIPFPTLSVSTTGKDLPDCKWGSPRCLTINYGIQYLQTTFTNGTLFQRQCIQIDYSATTKPVELKKNDLVFTSNVSTNEYQSSLRLSVVEGVVFTIEDESRLTVEWMKFPLSPLHQVVNVKSKDGRLAMDNCFVLSEIETTTSKSPICSVGSSLILNVVSFSSNVTYKKATLSAPLVHFASTPSDGDELGSGPCEITNCSLVDFNFEGTTMFKIETSGRVSFLLKSMSFITTDAEQGKYISLKGQSFKQQIEPSLWRSNPALADLPNYVGEDVSIDENDKWRTGSLVYWLVSPSDEILIGSVVNAVDHPNCGSSTFKCSTLDSAFRSSGLNELITLSLLTSTSLSSKLRATSSLLVQSSSAPKREIEFDENGWFEVVNSGTNLSFASIVFTVSETCQSATLFVVEEGELSFSLCSMGGTSSESALVIPGSTTTLIEVKADGTLTLSESPIQHINFSNAKLGTALRLHLGSTLSFDGTSTVADISSKAAGSHVVIVVPANHDPDSLSDLSTLIKPWAPTTTNGARFTETEMMEFVVIDEDGRVDELIYHWNAYDKKTMHIASDGGNHAKCGVSSLPCSSLSAEVEKVGAGETIVICSALAETAGFVATKDLSVTSTDNTKQVVSVSSSTVFSAQSSSLSFANLKFVPLPPSQSQNAESLERASSLFIIESGSIGLTGCSLSSFVLADSPLITHTTGSLKLKSCEISSIARSTGNGTVLETTMKAGLSISLDDVTFSLMTSSKESALLALSFPLLDQTDPVPIFDFTLTNLHFVEMIENEDVESCFVSVVGSRLADWVFEGDARFEGSHSETTQLSHFWSFDAFHELPASLLFYLLPSEGPVGVSRSGYDMAKCGSNSIWCPTISQSLGRLSAQKTSKIVVMDEIELSESLSLPNGVIFSGNDSKTLCACLVGEAGSLETSGENVVSITTLDFSLPLTQSADAVIVHSSEKLTLSHLRISSQGKSSAVFVRMSTGTAEMNDIVVRSEMSENSVLFSVLGGSVNMTSLSIETVIAKNETVVRMEGGTLTLTGMTLSSTKQIEGQLFSIVNSRFTLSDVKMTKQNFSTPLFAFSDFGESTIHNMNVSGCSGSTLIAAKNGEDLTLRFSEFSSLNPSTALNNGDSSDLCGWETSLVEITNTSAHFHQTEFKSIHHGALSVSDSILNVDGCIFLLNSPSNKEWPSLRRNIKCTNGTVSINGIGGGDGHSSPHHWISADECTVTKDDEIVAASLFVPTVVGNESSSSLDKKLKEYSVKVVGTAMLPCGLKLEVFEDEAGKSNDEGQPIDFDISSLNPSKWTETELSFVLSQESVSSLSKKYELRCRLSYGADQTTDSFSLSGSSKGNMSQGGVVASIVIPIVCALIIVVIVFLIIVGVLCRRRKTKKEAEQASQELNVPEDGMIQVKYELGDPDETVKPIFGASKDGSKQSSLLMVNDDNDQICTPRQANATNLNPVPYVSAIGCEGENGVITVDPRNTLYHRLHVENKKDLPKKMIAERILKGLERMMKERPSSEIFWKLSPHWIIMDYTNNVFLRIESQGPQRSEGDQMKAGESRENEDRRWNAPEQETMEGATEVGKADGGCDEMKVTVFRLGLVLWEMETEQVPFAEQDAVNASRQIKAGVMPLIHNWEDAELASLVSECLSLSPDDRPSLSDVKSRLSLLKSKPPILVPPQQNEPVVVSGVTG
ncbi:hypothetical protein BLNAU_17507 [Blattamonas nauphoetae]|uniref:Protein kinase domain-containing protein n=1 Tax=Blattamonas nauphoetae TaxID=2049346 RepID=A0ABQ9X6Y0_9EUKA|nr:hypothetical protein BLNAU_17507 [Blattamonas nauphoetae]